MMIGSDNLQKKKGRAISSFLKKTYGLLNDQCNQDVVRWANNGIGFLVLDELLFSKEVLPKYFKHSNYSSFVRQLNMYNFHKVRESNSESYFHHECFDRANQEKLAEIKRKPQKKKRKNEESDEEMHSQVEEKEVVKTDAPKKMKESAIPVLAIPEDSSKKIASEKNTHFFSSECNSERDNPNWKSSALEEQSEDKISINNEISERILPRLATRELFYPSTNNLFPFGGVVGQTSTFCLFF